jgi:hypothetical protein
VIQHGYLGVRDGRCRFTYGNALCDRQPDGSYHLGYEPVYDNETGFKVTSHPFVAEPERTSRDVCGFPYVGPPDARCGLRAADHQDYLTHEEYSLRHIAEARARRGSGGNLIGTLKDIRFPRVGPIKGLPIVPAPEREQFWPGSAEGVWQGHADAVQALLKTKQAYGNAWREQGYMGNLARIMSKASRLRNMLWRDGTWVGTGGEESAEEKESAVDTLLDLSALCALMAANLEDENRWGHDR